MATARRKKRKKLVDLFPPSPACTCAVCVGYCARPGWWTVAEASAAIHAGFAGRMMLELAPDRSFGVLSPAFKGNEGKVALQQYATRGCNFLAGERCQLFGSGLQPLECRFCHHDRRGAGPKCHAAVEADWRTPAGRELVARWGKDTGLWEQMLLFGLGATP